MPFDPSTLSGKRLWLRGKDQAGSGGSTVTSATDQSGYRSDPLSISGTTVATSATPSGGKAFRLSAAEIILPQVMAPIVATASSVFSGGLGSNPPSAALDGTTISGGWASANTAGPHWLMLRPSSSTVVTSYKMWGDQGDATHSPRDFTFEGSNDGSSWTTLDTRTSISWTTASQTFSFSNSTAYTFYRLNVSATAAGGYVAVCEIQLNATANTTYTGGGELWIVVKSNTTSGSAWHFGSGVDNHYTFGSDCYTDFGNVTRRNYTPSPSIASTWRLIRSTMTAAGAWSERIDETSQSSASSVTPSWATQPVLSKSWSGDIAEVLLLDTPATSGEIADLITYFNTEHGLSVPGGSVVTTPRSFTGSAARMVANAPKGAFSIGTPTPQVFTGSAAKLVVSAPAGEFSAGVVTTPQTFDGTPLGLIVTAPKGGYNTGATTVRGLPSRLILSSRPGAYFTSGLDGEADSYTVAWATAEDPIPVELSSADSRTDAWATAENPVSFYPASLDSYTLAWADAIADLQVTVDPVTGRPQYSLKVVEMNGDVITELSDVALGVASRALNGRGGFSAALGIDDDQQQHLPQFSEVQLWRGGKMVPGAWFVVADPEVRIDATTVGFDCLGLTYWFEHRLIGKERPELLKNGGFEEGARYWNFGYEAGSNAEAPPRWEITDEACEGGKALRIFAQDKVVEVKKTAQTAAIFYGNRPYASEPLSAGFKDGGEQKIRDLLAEANPPMGAHITVEGHTADADAGTGYDLSVRRAQAARAVILAARSDLTVTAVGKGETEPVDRRHIEAAYVKNRRVVIKGAFTQTKVGHRQFGWQSFEYEVDPSNREPVEIDFQVQGRIDQFEGPSKDGWMLYTDVRPVAKPNTVNNDDYVDIDETSPRGVWMGLHTAPKVPFDGTTYKGTIRLYPTAGATSFDQVSAKPNLKLAFWQKDPRVVIGGLVAHAQDPSFFKSDLNIQTVGPLSGFLIDRPYPWKDHTKVSDAIDEIVRSDNGPDANIDVTARTRQLMVAPKQGNRTGLTFATDGHVGDATIVGFASSVDGDDVATTAFVQSSWSGGGMTEVVERLPRPDGLVLESLFQAEQDAPTSTVREQARTAVRFGRADVITRVVMSNADTTMLLEQVTIGDVVWIEAHNARVDASGWYRIIQVDLDPNNDQLAYDVAPEV